MAKSDAKLSGFKTRARSRPRFLRVLLQSKGCAHTNRKKSKFRSSLLASLKHYIAEAWEPGEHSSETAIMSLCSWMKKFMRLRHPTHANPYMSG
ncbi:MAG: hypothetical protein DME60_08640 [Verrucomicrobia bacterium]|nr:MAG: hypothetical protein DME60_08640 [Verrucomicrobiota bacterium]